MLEPNSCNLKNVDRKPEHGNCASSKQKKHSVPFLDMDEQKNGPDGLFSVKYKNKSEQNKLCSDVVEIEGLEPSTSWLPVRRASQLRYTPIRKSQVL